MQRFVRVYCCSMTIMTLGAVWPVPTTGVPTAAPTTAPSAAHSDPAGSVMAKCIELIDIKAVCAQQLNQCNEAAKAKCRKQNRTECGVFLSNATNSTCGPCLDGFKARKRGDGCESTEGADAFGPLMFALGQALALILIGYYCRRLGFIPETAATGMGVLAGKFALPVLIFRAMATVDSSKVNFGLIASLVIAKWAVFVLACLIAAVAAGKGRKLEVACMLAMGATLSNDMALGLPVIKALYGDTSRFVDYLFIYSAASAILVNPIGITLLEVNKSAKAAASGEPAHGALKTALHIAKSVIFNPLVGMVLFGLVCNIAFGVTGTELPQFANKLVSTIGSAFPVCALFLTGMGMVTTDNSHADDSVHEQEGSSESTLLAIVTVLFKLLFVPIVAIKTAAQLTPNDGATGLMASTTYAFIVGAVPTAPALTAIIKPYGLDTFFAAQAVILGMIGFAPWTAIMTVFLASSEGGSLLAETRHALSSVCTFMSVTGCLFVVFGMVGCKQTSAKAFPRNTIFHLALAQGFYTVFALFCEHTDAQPTSNTTWMDVSPVYYASDYFRQQAVVWSLLRIFITLYFVPAKGVDAAKKSWSSFVAVAWIVPLLSTLTIIMMFKQESTIFRCWIQFGVPQLKLQLGIHSIKFCFAGACVVYCWCKKGKPQVAVKKHNDLEQSLEMNNSYVSASFRTSVASNAENKLGWSFGSFTALPEDTLRTETYAVIVMLNGLFHLVFIGSILSGDCGNILPGAACNIFVVQTLLFGIILEDGQGMFLLFLFGTRPHIFAGIAKLITTPVLVIRDCIFKVDAEQTSDLHPGCDKVSVTEQDAEAIRWARRMSDDQSVTNTKMYHLKKYKTCFTGAEAITWLVAEKAFQTRQAAVAMMGGLFSLGFVHHVHFEHHFKDSELFFTFSDLLFGWHSVQAGWLTERSSRSGLPSRYVLRERIDTDTNSVQLRISRYDSSGRGLDHVESIDLSSKCKCVVLKPFIDEGSGRMAYPIKLRIHDSSGHYIGSKTLVAQSADEANEWHEQLNKCTRTRVKSAEQLLEDMKRNLHGIALYAREWAKDLPEALDKNSKEYSKLALTHLFNHFDRNQNGTLEFGEFHKCVRVGAKLSLADLTESGLAKIFEAVDRDQGGTISIDELLNFVWPDLTDDGIPKIEASTQPQEPHGPPPDEPTGPPPR